MKALLNNQQQAIEKLIPLKVGALFKRPGTGKSRTAVELIKATPVNYILWLAPYGSVHPKISGSGIKDEVLKWGSFNCPIDFVGIESIQQSDRIYLEYYKKIKAHNTFIVCDESLFIKNNEAKRTKRIIELGQWAEYKLILNGTPISRNLLDVWAQMEFLSPKILNMGFAEFKNTFCEYTTVKKRFGHRWAQKEFITGFANIDYLYSLIRPYVYEADLQLSIGQHHINLHYVVEESIKNDYQKLKEKYLDNEQLQFLNNNIFLEMTQKMQHLYCCAAEKFWCADTVIKKHGEESIIIYYKYIESREALQKQYPKIPVLSLQSDSLSLNLQSRYVTIEWDKTWDFWKVDQYQFRTYRQGQTQDCYYYKLNADLKLDALIAANNDKKYNQLQYFKSITKEELKEFL